jgi:hypothetical protein
MSEGLGGSNIAEGRWSIWRDRYTDDYDRLSDPVVVGTNRAGAITAEQRRWYTAEQVRSKVVEALWLGGSALLLAATALGWFDRRLLLPVAVLALFYGVAVLRRFRDDPLASDLNAGTVSSAFGGLEASRIKQRSGTDYSLDVREIDDPYKNFRRFRIGRQVYDRLPHPTDEERRQIGPHRGLYTPSDTCRAYYLGRSKRLLSVELTHRTVPGEIQSGL